MTDRLGARCTRAADGRVRIQEVTHPCYNLIDVSVNQVGGLPWDEAPQATPPDVVAGGRPGGRFTQKKKALLKQDNASRNEGKTQCESCGLETVPAEQHKKGVPPPRTRPTSITSSPGPEVVQPSEHGTIRLIVSETSDVQAVRDLLRQLGCPSELSHLPRLIAVDVPPSISLQELKKVLDAGQERDRWGYKEACLPQI